MPSLEHRISTLEEASGSKLLAVVPLYGGESEEAAMRRAGVSSETPTVFLVRFATAADGSVAQ